MAEETFFEEKDGDVKWGSHKNIHRALSDYSHWLTKKSSGHEEGESSFEPAPVDSFFAQDACVTLKMDGSNLGIHIAKTEGPKDDGNSSHEDCAWTIKAVLGRKKPIWSSIDGDELSKLTKMGQYGNAGSLQALPIKMARFAEIFATACGVEEIAIYGEAYKAPGAQRASWHPFGFRLPREDWKAYLMNKQVHEKLMSAACAMPQTGLVEQEEAKSSPLTPDFNFKTQAELDTFLVKQKDHVVFPPPVLFNGRLGTAICSLMEVMTVKATPNFEGCFIVLESGSQGFKWKTGQHDEQPSVPKLDDFRFEQASTSKVYETLLLVYSTKLGAGKNKGKKAEDQGKSSHRPSQMKMDIDTAFARELSKRLSFAGTPKKDRLPIAQDMLKGVVEEVLSRYSEAHVACPYPEKDLRAKAPGMIKGLVMQVP
jgi:hypothetical protein